MPYTPVNIQSGYKPEAPKSLTNRVVSGIGNFGTGVVEGIAKGVGKTVLGIAQEQTKKPLVGLNVQTRSTSKSQPVIDSMSEFLEPTGVGQNVGYGLEKGAELLSPTKGIAKAKAITTGIAKGLTGGAPKLVSFTTKALLNALPETSFGFLYGKSQGESTEQAKKTALGFGAFSVVGEAVGGAYRALKGDLADNINKAIGVTGRMNLGSAQTRIPKATNALGLIAKSAPDITVTDISGVEKVFNPTKATFYETMQALAKTKQMVYDEYTGLTATAGEHGAKFTAKDFNLVISLLKNKAKDSVGAVKNKVQSLINDLEGNFASINPKDGGHYFKDTPLDRIQRFLEEINKDINPMSDKAGSVVSSELSQALREILDEKILKSTGNGYQALRTNYADLKSIEQGIINQWKKSVGKSAKGFGKYVEGYGGIEVLLSILSQNPLQAVRGGALAGLGKAMSYLRDPEMNLQRAFKLLLDNSPEAGTIRVFGGAKSNEAVQRSTEALKANQSGFTTLGSPPKGNGLATPTALGEFKGFSDLTTKVLDRLKGKSVTSKQEILNFTNMPELKQAERDVIRNVLDSYGGDDLAKEATKYKSNTDFIRNNQIEIPLSKLKVEKGAYTGTPSITKGIVDVNYDINTGKYSITDGNHRVQEAINRGDTTIKVRVVPTKNGVPTSDFWQQANSTKIPVQEFANKVKSELLPLKKNSSDIYKADSSTYDYPSSMVSEGNFSPKYEGVSLPTKLRGKVANYKETIYESPIATSAGDAHFDYATDNYFGHTRIEDMADNQTRRVIEVQSDLFQKGRLESEIKNEMRRDANPRTAPRKSPDIKTLEPYRNTWQDRIIREEVKQAAKDGKTKLQFPTGETAMKIEGLGDTANWGLMKIDDFGNQRMSGRLTTENIKIGQEIQNVGATDSWIITDVLGDGKFKAVPKNFTDEIKAFDESARNRIARGIDTPEASARLREQLAPREETFDISGKVDTNNPIYRFYEKEVGRYLKNKYQAQLVTDSKGVSWWEVAIKKGLGKLPVEAFGIGALGVGLSQRTKLGEKK